MRKQVQGPICRKLLQRRGVEGRGPLSPFLLLPFKHPRWFGLGYVLMDVAYVHSSDLNTDITATNARRITARISGSRAIATGCRIRGRRIYRVSYPRSLSVCLLGG
jgi:hypothetical protein